MCCQESSGQSPNPEDPNETAGFWGGLGTCDLPPVNSGKEIWLTSHRELMSNSYVLRATTLISHSSCGLETILTMKCGLKAKILN